MRIDDRFGLDVVLRVQRGMSNFPEKEAKKNNETLKTKNPRCVLGKTRYQEPFFCGHSKCTKRAAAIAAWQDMD